jgi:cytochrome oxidase assembly protein ShyY1
VLTVLRTLRQPRYAALSVLMLFVTLICLAAGTWQIYRFIGKVHANNELRGNFHAAAQPVDQILPLTTHDHGLSADGVKYRTALATGSYDGAHQSLLREQTVHGNSGYDVITPFRTSGGTLLVARGFVAGVGANGAPPKLPAPPAGQVTIRARVQPAQTPSDQAAILPGHQVRSVNPSEQAQRLGTTVYDGYAELLTGQPGTTGLVVIPNPSLSNPAGGAVEPQHFAYIIQWYLFAALAVAAPFAMARAESKLRTEDEIDSPTAGPSPAPATPELTPEQARAAKLADRYGRAVRH